MASYQEFYCQSGGSNLNAGSTTNNTATYTSNAGNWVQATRVFTPTDGVNPSLTVSVGMFASVYITAGATAAVYIGRVSAVVNAANGNITIDGTANCGAAPANGTGTMTIKVGGAWLGPNGASGFPLSLASWSNVTNVAGNFARFNLKNDQTYSITSAITEAATQSNAVMQGYTSTVGDGGRATIDGGSNAILVWTSTTNGLAAYVDLIFASSATTGVADLFSLQSTATRMIRCVFHGARGSGLLMQGSNTKIIECEAYDCNKSNTASLGAFKHSGTGIFSRCIAHDNTAGVNAHGFYIGGAQNAQLFNCIMETNGGSGLQIDSTSASTHQITNCDFYNNTGDAIKANADFGNNNGIYIENCNFIKNAGKAINNLNSTHRWGLIYNCGYGAGTQANGSADTLGDWQQFGTVTYASNVTPWVDPANGDFRVNLAAANFVGRGAFTETASSYAGTVGYPDIGAAQSKTGAGGTFSKEVSYAAAS